MSVKGSRSGRREPTLRSRPNLLVAFVANGVHTTPDMCADAQTSCVCVSYKRNLSTGH